MEKRKKKKKKRWWWRQLNELSHYRYILARIFRLLYGELAIDLFFS